MKKISILGSGWLGESLARALQKEGFVLKLSTTSSERLEVLQKKWDSVFQLNIQSKEVKGNCIDFLKSDILIVNITPNRTEPNQEQFAAFIPLLEQSSIQQVLFVSSTSVYYKLNKKISEDAGAEDVQHPLYLSEQLFLNNPHFQTTVVRMAGLIGENRVPGRFFSKSGRIQNSEAPVNLIEQEDCILIIKKIIEQAVWGEVFNACASEHPSKGDFYTRAARAIGLEAPFCDGKAEENSFNIIDNRKIRERLGVEFRSLPF